MIISSLIVPIKLASALGREMVYSEATAAIVPRLYQVTKQWIVDSLPATRHPDVDQASTSAAGESTADGEQTNNQQPPESTEYLVHNWLEALFAWFQVIILWHEPYVSFNALSGLLTSFLLLTYFAPRFYATIMIALFIYHANKFWFGHVWPAIRVPPERGREEEMRLDVDRWTYLHPQLMTLAELGQLMKNLIKLSETQLKQLMLLRQEKPVAFCLLICSILSCTAYIGNRLSGISLIFSSTTALVLAPGIYLNLLPEPIKEWIRENMGLRILKLVQSSSWNEQEQFDHNTSESTSTTPLLSAEQQQPPPPPTTTNESETETVSTSPFSGLAKEGAASIEKNVLLPLLEHFKRKQQKEDEEGGGDGEKLDDDDETSSNKSESPLVDPEDDDQQDGFVLL